jgi:hypothetical protein
MGLDGKEHKLILQSTKRKTRAKSAPHQKALSLLLEILPGVVIFEEVTLPGCGLYLDIFLPSISLAVEVHGRQHYEFVPFFHKTKADFLLARKRDRDKLEWCNLNDITLVVLPYDGEDEWKNLISSAISLG